MAIPSNRDQHKDWCLRQLGHPVININVDDDQVDDCVDASLQYFQDFHFDGVERWYLKHELTSDDMTNQYFQYRLPMLPSICLTCAINCAFMNSMTLPAHLMSTMS